MKQWRNWLAVASLAMGLPAAAASAVVVDAVQAPAWVERGGQAIPLKAGEEVRLKLAEGSTVKLGRQASFGVERAESGGVFRATFAATAGALRFTTDEARKGQARDVEIRTLNVTAGVRGTDLWGKTTPEREFVVLIEGRITVGPPGQAPVTLSTPLDYYERRGGGARVRRLDAATLAEYARETEMGTFSRPAGSIP